MQFRYRLESRLDGTSGDPDVIEECFAAIKRICDLTRWPLCVCVTRTGVWDLRKGGLDWDWTLSSTLDIVNTLPLCGPYPEHSGVVKVKNYQFSFLLVGFGLVLDIEIGVVLTSEYYKHALPLCGPYPEHSGVHKVNAFRFTSHANFY